MKQWTKRLLTQKDVRTKQENLLTRKVLVAGQVSRTGVLCLQIWKNASSKEAQLGLDWIIANQKQDWKQIDVYEWYYHAQACFQATGVSGGSKYWRAWNKNFSKLFVEPKHLMDIGRMESIFMETPTFIVLL